METQKRRYELDWLRVIAFALLIFYHTGMMFVPWDWHIKNAEHSELLKNLMLFINQWRLPLLFFISGAGVSFALRRRTNMAFLKERMVRLIIPLMFGILLIVPPQVYYERLTQGFPYASYLDFYPDFFKGIYPTGNFSWHHLWFIMYLFVFVLAALPLFSLIKRKKEAILHHLQGLSTGRKMVYMLVPVVIMSTSEALLRSHWPSTHNLVSDWANQAYYFILFVSGYLFTIATPVADKIYDLRKWLLTSGIISVSCLFWMIHTFTEADFEQYMIFYRMVKVLNMWLWLMILLSYARKFLFFNNKFLSYANEAVYPFYILHQTIIVAIGFYLIQMEATVSFKFWVVSLGTYISTWLIYDLIIKRILWLRFCFGMKPMTSKAAIQYQTQAEIVRPDSYQNKSPIIPPINSNGRFV